MKDNVFKPVRHVLTLLFGTMITLAVLIVIAFENELFMPGAFADRAWQQLVTLTGMELLTIVCIPAALYLFRLPFIRRSLKRHGVKALLRWSIVRLLLLTLPLVANTLLYYLFMAVAFGYMAIILLLSLCFVYPSEARCRMELPDED